MKTNEITQTDMKNGKIFPAKTKNETVTKNGNI